MLVYNWECEKCPLSIQSSGVSVIQGLVKYSVLKSMEKRSERSELSVI